ncbi:hypothetical protein [Pseudoalteromonas xiamenensis]
MMLKHLINSLLIVSSSACLAGNLNWKMESGVELRGFEHAGLGTNSDATVSLYAEPEFTYETSQGTDIFSGKAFLRADNEDAQRSHADIRELSWLHINEESDLRIGISRVFWGVTESQHLVDVINQTDLVENPDGEAKLGQPMIQWAWMQDWGTLDLYALVGFRERRFPGEDGRFRTLYPIDKQATTYEATNNKDRIDLAVRYSRTIESWDFAVSHFSGTARTPVLEERPDIDGIKYAPHYPLLEQTGFVSQYVQGDWLWKVELISAQQQNQRFTASTFGFEYTQVGVFSSQADLGWLVEYSFDDRGTNGPSSFEHDWFAGWRLSANDPQSSEALLGLLWDPASGEKSVSIEASTRLGNDIKIAFEMRSYSGSKPADDLFSDDDKLLFLSTESYAQLEVAYYF